MLPDNHFKKQVLEIVIMSPVYTRRTHATQIEGESLMAANRSGGEQAAASPVALSGVVRDKRLRKLIQMIESDELSSVHALAIDRNLSPSHLQHLSNQHTDPFNTA